MTTSVTTTITAQASRRPAALRALKRLATQRARRASQSKDALREAGDRFAKAEMAAWRTRGDSIRQALEALDTAARSEVDDLVRSATEPLELDDLDIAFINEDTSDSEDARPPADKKM